MKSQNGIKNNFVSKTKKNILKITTTVLIMTLCFSTQAQETVEMDEYKAFNAGLHLKNMHTWHGFVVQTGPIFATNLEFNSRNKKFTLGLWGGASTDGNYKEIAMYTVYRFTDKFYVEAVSHNNYTNADLSELHVFQYSKTQPYNFVDLNFGYNLTDNTSLYLATILGGSSGDYELQDDGDLQNSYTHYLEFKSQVWQKGDSKLSLFAGGAFSFTTDKTFYSPERSAAIVNVGGVFSKDVKLGNHTLPIEVTAMWNPEKERAVLQVDLAIF